MTFTGRCMAAFFGLTASFSLLTPSLANERNVLDGDAMLITSGDPQEPTYANAGENLRNGVGSMFIEFAGTAPFGFICSMAVIGDRHILTAAHCVREAGDTVSDLIIVLPSGANIIAHASGFAVHYAYDFFNPLVGAFAPGDVAVIELPFDLPPEIERYDLYRDGQEFGKETRHYGHGRSGKGTKGATGGTDFFYARTGLNRYEQTLKPFFGGNPWFDQLLHDFDSGGRKHNAMEWWFTSAYACHPDNPKTPDHARNGQCTTFKDGSFPDFKGFGKLEVGVAPGDSGGPGFVDGMIAGVHSFGFTHSCVGSTNKTDFTCGLDSSYGEMSGDTRVSSYAGWIDAVVAGHVEMTPIPEGAPATTSGTSEGSMEISLGGKEFMENTLSRRLRETTTVEEFKARFGVE